MRMKRLSRSSRPTGPKMRVPRGCCWSLMRTAAFSSNLMYEPSGRRFSFFPRTTTHLTTSPFLTAAPGMASLTVATKMSPIEAYRRREPPSTLMQSTSLAPELSATLSRDSCWIIGASLRPLEHVGDPPTLQLRQRPGLHHADPVADVDVVGLVVGVQLLGLQDELVVLRVTNPLDHGDDDRLVGLAGDDDALACLAHVTSLLARCARVRLCLLARCARVRLLASARDAGCRVIFASVGGRSGHCLGFLAHDGIAFGRCVLCVAHDLASASAISRARMSVLMRAI